MKKVFFSAVILIFFLGNSGLWARNIKKKTSFSDINMITLGPKEDSTPYEVFTIGENSQSFTAKRYITPFKMNAYETTYNLWFIVRIYAEQKGYTFANPGQGGSKGKRGGDPTPENAFQPVTMISWYDAIVWCNALSEMEGKTPCYTFNGKILKDSTDTASCDRADCNWKADGYRLPSEAEWEYAARVTPTGFQSGSLASGQTEGNADPDDDIPEDAVSWFDGNTDMTRTVGTAGTIFSSDAPPAAGSGRSNFSGLYDMSGNVMEYCWDWLSDYKEITPGSHYAGPAYGNERVSRGGSWFPYSGFIGAGDRYGYDPNEIYNFIGFRFCTSN